MRLDASNLPDLARGCAILGAGGGGDTDVGLAMALHAIAQHGPVPVVTPDDLPPDGLVLPCGIVGAPTLATERLFSGGEGRELRAAVERLHDGRVVALMPFGIAGATGMAPVTWAAAAGLPLLDADGMGRAFPGLRRQAMHLAGIRAGPVVLTDGRGNTLVLKPADDGWVERLVGGAVAGLGGVGAAAVYVMTVAAARTAAIAGSVSLAVRVGAAMGSGGPARRVAAVRETLRAEVLIEGRVIAVERSADEGFVRGSATVQGMGADADRQLRLELQNELLLALSDGEVRAAVPDVICALGADTGAPIPTERLRYGERLVIVGAPAPAVWRTAAALALVGPAAFGYAGVPAASVAEVALHAAR